MAIAWPVRVDSTIVSSPRFYRAERETFDPAGILRSAKRALHLVHFQALERLAASHTRVVSSDWPEIRRPSAETPRSALDRPFASAEDGQLLRRSRRPTTAQYCRHGRPRFLNHWRSDGHPEKSLHFGLDSRARRGRPAPRRWRCPIIARSCPMTRWRPGGRPVKTPRFRPNSRARGEWPTPCRSRRPTAARSGPLRRRDVSAIRRKLHAFDVKFMSVEYGQFGLAGGIPLPHGLVLFILLHKLLHRLSAPGIPQPDGIVPRPAGDPAARPEKTLCTGQDSDVR